MLQIAHIKAYRSHMRGETTVRIDDLVITISERQPDGAFTAWFGDYDLGCMTGWGKTRLAAASDLLDTYREDQIAQLEQVLQ